MKTFDENFAVQLPLFDLNYTYTSDEYREIMKDVRKQYFGEKAINRDTLTQFVRLLDDVLFIYGIDKAAKVQANRSTGKTFYYQYVCVVIITICLHRSTHPSFMYSRFRRIPFIFVDDDRATRLNDLQSLSFGTLSHFSRKSNSSTADCLWLMFCVLLSLLGVTPHTTKL